MPERIPTLVSGLKRRARAGDRASSSEGFTIICIGVNDECVHLLTRQRGQAHGGGTSLAAALFTIPPERGVEARNPPPEKAVLSPGLRR